MSDVLATSRVYRCVCCDGAMEGLSDEAVEMEFEATLGFVSPEPALICVACTTRLMDAHSARRGSRTKRQ
jgi:hypothetical protein